MQDNIYVPSVNEQLPPDQANLVPTGQIESAVYEEVCYTTKELKGFANSFRQKSG